MISDHDPLLSTADLLPSLEKTLEKNQDVKDKLENCAVELSTFNETAKIKIAEMAESSMLQHAEKTLAQSENAGEKMLECAIELQEVNDAIIQEIGGREGLNRNLEEITLKLVTTRNTLSDMQEVLVAAHKVVEEASASLARSEEKQTELRHGMTESRLAGKKLFEEKERLRVTLNHIGDAVITTDMAGHVSI
ncbi:MAG: hypothetical protein ABI167_07885 [Nitrosospira sp.]